MKNAGLLLLAASLTGCPGGSGGSVDAHIDLLDMTSDASRADMGVVERPDMDVGVARPDMDVGVERRDMDVGVERRDMDIGVERRDMDVGVDRPDMDHGVPIECDPSADPVDLDGVDANGDGVDGIRDCQIYVDVRTGLNDSPGTDPAFPLATLARAVEVANGRPILLAAGRYDWDSAREIADPSVRIHGGYSADFSAREGRSTVELRGFEGWQFTALARESRLSRLDIVSADVAPAPDCPAPDAPGCAGVSRYGLRISSDAARAPLLRLESVSIELSDAGAGAVGVNGAPGLPGLPGAAGAPCRLDGDACVVEERVGQVGLELAAIERGPAAAPSPIYCGDPVAVGGRGGASQAGGHSASGGALGGRPGQFVLTAGLFGCLQSSEAGHGLSGGGGDAGADGAPAHLGPIHLPDLLRTGRYLPPAPISGGAGASGQGGGGGGGGAAMALAAMCGRLDGLDEVSPDFACDAAARRPNALHAPGPSGGSGGGGGCGGAGGTGGHGGGAVIGLVARGVRLALDAVEIALGDGGRAGQPGLGGPGGGRGDGGSGVGREGGEARLCMFVGDAEAQPFERWPTNSAARSCFFDGGDCEGSGFRSGAGGPGGVGGDGACGSSGPGGPVIGVVQLGDVPVDLADVRVLRPERGGLPGNRDADCVGTGQSGASIDLIRVADCGADCPDSDRDGIPDPEDAQELQIYSGHDVSPARCDGDLQLEVCSSGFYEDIRFPQPFDRPPHVLVVAEETAERRGCYLSGASVQFAAYPTDITPEGFRLWAFGSPSAECPPGIRNGKSRARAAWIAIADVPGVASGHGVVGEACSGELRAETCDGWFYEDVQFDEPFAQPPHILTAAELVSAPGGCPAGATDQVAAMPIDVDEEGFRFRVHGSPFGNNCPGSGSLTSRARGGWLALSRDFIAESANDVVPALCDRPTPEGVCATSYYSLVDFAVPFTRPPHVLVSGEFMSNHEACVGYSTDKLVASPSDVTSSGFELTAHGSASSGPCGDFASRASAGWLAIE